jgi:hypothetical protein
MIKKYQFIDRVVYLVRKGLEEILPEQATLDEMYFYLEKILKKFKGK